MSRITNHSSEEYKEAQGYVSPGKNMTNESKYGMIWYLQRVGRPFRRTRSDTRRSQWDTNAGDSLCILSEARWSSLWSSGVWRLGTLSRACSWATGGSLGAPGEFSGFSTSGQLRLGLIHYFHIINKTYIRFWLITFSGSICSTRRSSIGMKEGDKWQFWKKTHFPRSIELFIIASAIGPCYSGKFNSFNLEAIYADDINVRNMLSLNTSVIAPVPDRERSRSASFQSAFRQRTCRDQQQGRCPARARTRSALWAKSPWISLPTLSSAIKYILKFYLFVYVEFSFKL